MSKQSCNYDSLSYPRIIANGSPYSLIPEHSLDLKELYRRLDTMELFQADQITFRWTVTSDFGLNYTSSLFSGQSLVTESGRSLQVYVRGEYVRQDRFPLELATQLSAHCGITDSDQKNLVQMIMTDGDIQFVERELTSRGYSQDNERSFMENSDGNDPYASELDATSPENGMASEETEDDEIKVNGNTSQNATPPENKMASEETVDGGVKVNGNTSQMARPADTRMDYNSTQILAFSKTNLSDYNAVVKKSSYDKGQALDTQATVSESQWQYPGGLHSKVMRFVQGNSAQRRSSYGGGLDETALLSLYSQARSVERHNHARGLLSLKYLIHYRHIS